MEKNVKTKTTELTDRKFYLITTFGYLIGGAYILYIMYVEKATLISGIISFTTLVPLIIFIPEIIQFTRKVFGFLIKKKV